MAGVLGEAMVSYFRTHPYSAERARRLEALVKRNHKRLSGQDFYVGRTNYDQKTSRDQKEFPDNSLRF
jgi:predicted Zn-dependent protease